MIKHNSTDPSVSVILLAGGQSSRMGKDKALLAPAGIPLIRCVYNIAQQCAESVYVVTPWPERYQAVLPESCQFVQELVLPPDTKPQGPLVGLALGLAVVQTEWVLALACDLPRLRLEVLQDWMAQLQKAKEEEIAVLPRDSKGWQPLCGFYRLSCLHQLREYIQAGGRSFQDWLRKYPVRSLAVSDAEMFFNCNTPADLEMLKNQG